jgi:hypothetical protein
MSTAARRPIAIHHFLNMGDAHTHDNTNLPIMLPGGVMPLRDGAEPELYDLDDDPGEQRNVAKEKPAIVKELIASWARWETDANLSSREYSR